MSTICQWSNDDIGGDSVWESSCKHDFYFDGADGPRDAGFTHCPFCGRPLTERLTSEEAKAADAVDPVGEKVPDGPRA